MMENYFAKFSEDIRTERLLLILIKVPDDGILKESDFTDHEKKIVKNLALEKLHRQKRLGEYFASQKVD